MIKEEITRQRPRRRVVLVLLAMAAATVLASFAAVQPAQAAFPGQNGKIVFESDRDGISQIYSMNPDGSDQTNLKTLPGAQHPAVSPDGTKIAFDSDFAGGPAIYILDLKNHIEFFLTNNANTSDTDPTFSPDGAKITFVSDRDGNDEIYVMNANGSNQTRLTNNGARDSEPTFSPDGTKIAFTSTREDSQGEIYVMDTNPATNDATRLTNHAGEFDFAPNFSPNGKKIAFTSSQDGDNEIYVMNADGSGQKKLTKNAKQDFRPAFSPDGKKIVFGSFRNGTHDIYRMNAKDGSKQKRLTKEAALDQDADWGVAAQ